MNNFEENYIINEVTENDYLSFKNVFLQLENTIDFTEETFISVINENNKRNNFYKCIRLKSNNEIIGCGKIFFDIKLGNNKAYIDDIIIDKKYRNYGLGKYLINNLINIAKGQKCYLCLLSCKDELKVFYEKIGFQKEKTLMSYYL